MPFDARESAQNGGKATSQGGETGIWHPRFHGLFVHPKSHSPLAFFGLVQGYDGVPVHVLSKNHRWSEGILSELEKVQGQKWITGNWENGFLWSLDDPEMYPVIQGIPVFVPPPKIAPSVDTGNATREVDSKELDPQKQRTPG